MFETGGILGTYVDFTGAIRDENALIQQYRGIALYPEVDNAIEDICNDAIVMGSDRKPVKLSLDKVKLSDAIKNKLYGEFDYVLRLLDFHNKAYEIFRRWYVDSKLFSNKKQIHKFVDLLLLLRESKSILSTQTLIKIPPIQQLSLG
mgnify:CR=1 FL=1